MSDASVFGLLARLVLSLGVVLSLMAGAAWIVRRRSGLLRSSATTKLEVLARQSLSRTASVQVIKLGERALVLGVTEQSVTYLTEGEADEFSVLDVRAASRLFAGNDDDDSVADMTSTTRPPRGSSPTRTSVLDTLRDITARR